MTAASSSRSLLLALVAGALLLAGGLLAARVRLPAAAVGELPPRERFDQAFEALARRQGVDLLGGRRVRLRSGGDDSEMARRMRGDDSDGSGELRGRGVQIEVSEPAEWAGSEGQLKLVFGARGLAVSADWTPSAITDFFSQRAPQPEGICGLLLGRGESLGPAQPWVQPWQPAAISVADVVGARFPSHMRRVDPQGAAVGCVRGTGDAAAALRTLRAQHWEWGWLRGVPVLGFVLCVLALFVVLLFRGRVDLWNAVLLAGAFLATCLLGDWSADLPTMIVQLVGVPVTAIWLLLLWSSGESWARAHLPAFTTTLDTLRRGRLGARAGRELLLGWAGGAALAGLRLLLYVGAASLPFTAPRAAAAPLPLFALTSNPIHRGMAWTMVLVIVMTLARRWLPGRTRGLALLLVPLFASPVLVTPWWAEYVAGAILSAGLLLLLRAGGLTAGLLGATFACWWPSAVLAARYPRWLPVTLAVSAVALLLPLLAGWVGLARGETVEHDPGAVPEFLRREERERRLEYEMDLLARMQLGLLPQSLPRIPGYEVTARSFLATEAGGDLYDFLRDERGRLWIAAGDVSGHGYSCAIGQASLKASLHSLVDGHATPARVLERMDRVLRHSVGVRMFATFTLVALEEATGRVVVANAGHPFPLLLDPRDGAREIELPGLPLGQGPARRYRDVEVMLPRGGLLLLFSDGLYEAVDPGGRPYGFDRPRQVLAEAASWNAAEVLERLVYDWRRHLAGSPSADDTTLVVLKRL